MRTLGLLLVLSVLIITLTMITYYVEENNGIPDVLAMYFPEHFVDQEAEIAATTLQAPFAAADRAAKPVELDPDIKYDPLGGQGRISEKLDVAHRNEVYISEWILNAMAETLTFKLADYQPHMQSVQDYMSEEGFQEFYDFLNTAGVLSLMQNKQYDLYSSVADTPILIRHGVAGGRYSWLYEVPVDLTFVPIGSVDYEQIRDDGSSFETEALVFKAQVSRTTKGEGREDMLIAAWELMRRR